MTIGVWVTHVVGNGLERGSLRDKSVDHRRLVEDDGASQCCVAVLRQNVLV